jgi:MEMO1 family protein
MRQPAVADRFYPGSPKSLSLTLTELFPATQPTNKSKALAVVSPHAGYVYSGALAAKTFCSVEIPETVIILGPNHHGQGAPVSLSTDTWNMPFGMVPVDMEIANHLLDVSQQIKIDETAHQFEHSLEVQVPFLQMLQKKLCIVPLVLSRISYPLCEEVAESLAAVINSNSKDILIVASSDMSHYESRRSAEQKDLSALKCIERMDPLDLYHTVLDNHISMCGVIPVVIALLAAKACGAKQSSLIGYTDSGYISGDADQVVGYAGVVII